MKVVQQANLRIYAASGKEFGVQRSHKKFVASCGVPVLLAFPLKLTCSNGEFYCFQYVASLYWGAWNSKAYGCDRLWDCDFAQDVWQTSLFTYISSIPNVASWLDIVDNVLQTKSTPNLEISFTIAWKIWTHRNTMWLENKFTTTPMLSLQAVSYVEEFIEVNMKQVSSERAELRKWSPPLNPLVENLKRILLGLLSRIATLMEWNQWSEIILENYSLRMAKKVTIVGIDYIMWPSPSYMLYYLPWKWGS